MKAREVLADCKLALQLLEEETDLQRWRVHWAAAIALIRAVGHVLDKVDGLDASIKKAANQRYRLWQSKEPEHEIFREFIDKERNNLLKEYQVNVHPLENVSIAVQTYLRSVTSGETIVVPEVFEIDENIYRPMMNGPWEGHDARDVLSEAITWWEKELDIVHSLSSGSMS